MKSFIEKCLKILVTIMALHGATYAQDKLIIKIATEDEIDDARHILHKVYVDEQGWAPSNDPTNIQLKKDNQNRAIFTNTYDNAAMVWIAYVDDTPVGTIRISSQIDR